MQISPTHPTCKRTESFRFIFIPLFESIPKLSRARELGFSRSVPEKLSEMDASMEKRAEADKNTNINSQSEYDSSEDRERQSRELKAGLHPLKVRSVYFRRYTCDCSF